MESDSRSEKQHIIPIADRRVSPADSDQSNKFPEHAKSDSNDQRLNDLLNFHLELLSHSSDDLLNTCRICRDETVRGLLVSPCLCSGTLGKCHVQCLEEWLSKANKDSCEICGHEFHVRKLPRSFQEWFTKGQSRRERRYLCGDLICFLILSPLVFASSYLCAQGAWHYMALTDTWTGAGLIVLSLFLWCIYGFWLIVTLRFHQRCWQDWRERNYRVKLVKIEIVDVKERRKDEGLLETSV
ncbi:hypothetical protein pdam_00000802 [Pocillopora damicornis]|uniref:RING-CH-type domain-containing protein n=1 Tax=Pocillopora damicornis TaxID=46731 RepID=A0A3M6TV63_POCDA|nr:hypothetical protein pdam_00000802 [Pocillopora damicornis]